MADETFEAMVKLLADNRGFIKAFRESGETAKTTGKDVTRSSDEASLSMDRLRTHATFLRDTMMSLASMVGIGGVAFGLKDLAEEGVKLQASQVQLQGALKNTGQDAGGMADKLQQFSDNLSQHGGFGSQAENMTALAKFITETRSATKAQEMLVLATNIARGTGKDLGTTVSQVARAYAGQARGLQQLLGPMVAARNAQVGLTVAHQAEIAKIQEQASFLSGPAKTAFVAQSELADHLTAQQMELAQLQDKQLTGQEVIAAASKVFAGDTARYANSIQGRQSDLDHTFENLTETIGLDLLPVMKVLLTIGTAVAGVLEKHHTLVEALSVAVGGLVAAWGAMKILGGIKAMVVDLGKAFGVMGAEGEGAGILAAIGADTAATAWRAFMTTTIFGLVVVGLVELVEHWKAVESAAVAVWHGIESAAVSVWHAIVAAARWGFHEIKSLMNDLGFTGNGVMSYLNPFGLERHALGAIGSLFNQGGVVQYRAEGGPMMPMGSDTVPAMLTPGEGVLSVQGMDMLSRLNSGMAPVFGGGGQFNINASDVTMRLDNDVLGRAFLRWIINKGARGPSTIIGGSSSLAISGIGTAGR